MKAWLIDEQRGIERLRLAEVPDPVPAEGEVVLRILYSALNPADRYLAEGLYPARPKFPHILGRDGFGVIEALGENVSGVNLGDRRAILRGDTGGDRPGTFAEKVAVPAEDLVQTPEEWVEQQSAGATLVYLTAYQALTMWGSLPQNAIVLVTGASGGVGVASIQLAVAMGCQVIGLSRSPEKSAKLRDLGAALMFDPSDPDWRKTLKEALGSRRVDLAIDNIGGKLLPEVIDALGNLGKVSIVGRLAGPIPSFNTSALLFRRIRIGGVAVGAYTKKEARSSWAEVLNLMQCSGARPLVDSVFPFESLPKAFERLSQGSLGKVVVAHGPR